MAKGYENKLKDKNTLKEEIARYDYDRTRIPSKRWPNFESSSILYLFPLLCKSSILMLSLMRALSNELSPWINASSHSFELLGVLGAYREVGDFIHSP
ncbi:hypothetical protein AKJ16_DCAP26749 [Drosera capensis]